MTEPNGASNSEESLLIARAAQSDPEAIEQLIERHLPGLRAFIRMRSDAVIRAKESCSDILQSVCREVLQHLDEFEYRGAGSFRNWLFTCAQNKILNRSRYWRAGKRDPGREAARRDSDDRLLDEYATFSTPSRAANAREQIDEIEGALDRLPEHYRDIIVQVRLIGLSYTEIAHSTGRSEASLRQQLKRALLRLTTEIERGEP